MDPIAETKSPFEFFRAHPFIPVSLVLSAAAIVFGVAGLASSGGWVSGQENLAQAGTDIFPVTVAVDVEGEVARPGLIELEVADGKTARVSDAIEQAGGLLPSSDNEYVEKNLNMAAPVSDGMKLYVPKKGEMAAKAVTDVSEGKVNVNTATSAELTGLKGIGESRAKTIIENRPYTSIEELATKAKLSQSLLDSLKDDISF